MKGKNEPPRSMRGKVVYFIWRIVPRFFLVAMGVFIFVLSGNIKDEKNAIKTRNASAMTQEKVRTNTVVMPLKPGIIRERIDLPGSIEPWIELSLKTRVDGMISDILVKEGDVVEKGDVLARIDTDDYRIALDRAIAEHRLATANFSRDKAVFGKGFIPVSQLDIRETSMQLAKSDLENARLQLARCTIKAPMAGVINRLDAEVGSLLSVGDPVAHIVKIDRVKAVVGIPESDMPSVTGLHSIALIIKALDNRRVVGQKYFLSSVPETAARLYRLELALDNQDGDILPGMFVRADVVKKEIDNAIAIPFYSVISRNDEQYVFVEEEGVALKRNVSLGIMEKWMVAVTEGLQEGDRLIVEGHRDVEDGQEIKVVNVLTGGEENNL